MTQGKQRVRAVKLASDHELLESMPDGVVVVSPDGLIAYANRRAEGMTGYRRGELHGHAVEDLVPRRLRIVHMAHRREYSSRMRPRAMGAVERDFRVRRKDGSDGAVYLYHVADNERTMRDYGHQAVVLQTALNPVIALELLAAGTWQGTGVLGPEAFPPDPFLELLADYGEPHGVVEGDPRKG